MRNLYVDLFSFLLFLYQFISRTIVIHIVLLLFFQLVYSNLMLDHLPRDLGQENEERRLNPVVYQESDNWTDELWAC